MTTLFDLPAGAVHQPVPESLSAGGRRRVRQAAAVAAGVHPLALVMAPISMHPDASRAATALDPPNLPLRCGTCWWRRDTAWGYPKCWHDGDARISHGDATTVRAWWPACTDYRPVAAGDPALAPAACERCHGARQVSGGGGVWPCPACCCVVCGRPTPDAPECGDCFVAEDVAAVRRADR
jgi:hypothetical protein